MTRQKSETHVKEKLGDKFQTSVFYPEEDALVGYGNRMKARSTKALPWGPWKPGLKVPSTSKWSLTELLRTIEQPKAKDEQDETDDLKQSVSESRDIETVRKENFFNEEITEEERDIIANRVALQQRRYAAYEQREKTRKTARIKAVFDYVTDEEIAELLKECDQDEDEAVSRLLQPDVLKNIRRKIAFKYEKAEEVSHLPTVEQLMAHQQLARRRPKRNTTDDERKKYHLVSKLGLDDAVQQCETQVDPEKAFEGWSDARINAYKNIDVNANRFYYRFNAPGETQRTGPWDENEKELFLARLAELGVGGEDRAKVQWGIFSMGIPGRVGYQCSSYYRQLVEKQKIVDPNYVFDEKNKARFLFATKDANGEIQRTIRTFSRNRNSTLTDTEESNKPSSSSTTTMTAPRTRASSRKTAATATVKKSNSNKKKGSKSSVKTSRVAAAGSRKRRRSRGRARTDDGDSDIDDDNSGNFTSRGRIDGEPRITARRRCPTAAASEPELVDEDEVIDEEGDDCPLPDFIDPITLEQVVNPAISKYGHVMGYDSWIRCLHKKDGPRDICPLTKKPLTKRDLVILTFENLDEYKDKIVM